MNVFFVILLYTQFDMASLVGNKAIIKKTLWYRVLIDKQFSQNKQK